MSVLPFDQRDGFIWMNGNLVAWRDAKLHVLSHGLHYASCVFEGERAYGGRIFKSTRTFGAVPNLGGTARFRNSLFRGGIGQGEATRCRQKQSAKLLCPPGRLARQRNDGGRGAEFDDQRRHRRLGLAEHVRRRAENERHQARYRRLPAARSADRAVPRQGRRALYDLHHFQTSGRAARLCRCHDARLAGAGRRMHRRQYLLHRERRDPHARSPIVFSMASPGAP